MKNIPANAISQILSMLCCVFLMGTGTAWSQDADVVITLEVRAANLFNNTGNLNKKKIEDQCRIKDVRNGQLNMSDFGRVKQHETQVDINDDVLWEIVSLDEGFTIAIDHIVPVLTGNQKNFFRKYVLGADNGKVRDKIRDLNFPPGASNKDKSYPYQVFFTITSNGVSKPFFVDPKLKGGDD